MFKVVAGSRGWAPVIIALATIRIKSADGRRNCMTI